MTVIDGNDLGLSSVNWVLGVCVDTLCRGNVEGRNVLSRPFSSPPVPGRLRSKFCVPIHQRDYKGI